MNTIRQAVGELFGSPMQNMSFLSYFQYVNTAGKITARSLMELTIVCLTYLEEQERKNEKYEDNFKEIEQILQRLVEGRTQPTITEEKEFFAIIPEVEKITEAIEKNTSSPSKPKTTTTKKTK